MTWRVRFAYWVTKATYTHSEYVLFIAFPLQQWLHERASLLRYTYFVYLVCVNKCRDKVSGVYPVVMQHAASELSHHSTNR
jgi:hypothetical protein